ncbi:ATP-binding cassette domain-containing protein [Nocardiopsis potens]|uniref:ATP-binding cassette domain-containing protein n=1 Tax=Nocardiopsis potens TaxID=1246458 RepID=UPI000348BBE8|nr:ABC transporter ATP-binding protein [Nocardiopsis potens]
MSGAVLAVTGLRVRLGGRTVIDGLDLVLPAGRVTALVGRSGSGKSLAARSLLGLAPRGAERSGAALLDLGGGRTADLLAAPPDRLRALRGREVGYVFQEAQASLNPTITVGAHLAETLKAHGVPRGRRREQGLAALRGAGLDDPAALLRAYPFELSGGQAQRVALALARALRPRLLIADEVTSALDPVTQAGVLDVLRADAAAPDGSAPDGSGRALLLVTHDLAVAGRWADRIAVLDGGRIAEEGPARDVLAAPRHPFTAELVRAAAPAGSPPGPGEPAGAPGAAR